MPAAATPASFPSTAHGRGAGSTGFWRFRPNVTGSALAQERPCLLPPGGARGTAALQVLGSQGAERRREPNSRWSQRACTTSGSRGGCGGPSGNPCPPPAAAVVAASARSPQRGRLAPPCRAATGHQVAPLWLQERPGVPARPPPAEPSSLSGAGLHGTQAPSRGAGGGRPSEFHLWRRLPVPLASAECGRLPGRSGVSVPMATQAPEELHSRLASLLPEGAPMPWGPSGGRDGPLGAEGPPAAPAPRPPPAPQSPRLLLHVRGVQPARRPSAALAPATLAPAGRRGTAEEGTQPKAAVQNPPCAALS